MQLLTDYRIPQARLLNAEAGDRPWTAIEKAWNAYADCSPAQRRTLLRRLTPGQRAFVALNGLEAEVNNGGIHQFFWNSTGDLYEEALAGLRLVGAKEYERLFQSALKLFPDATLCKSRQRRQRALRKIGQEELGKAFDETFYALERRRNTKLETLLRAYLAKHPEQFVLPGGQKEPRSEPLAAKREYRIPAAKANHLRGEKLHWVLVKKYWDLYWQALRGGEKEFVSFIQALSEGQRALAALLLLQNGVALGGLHHFFGNQLRSDLVIPEVSKALERVKALPYIPVFRNAVRTAGDLPALNCALSERSAALQQSKERADRAGVEAARKLWWSAHLSRKTRADELFDSLESATQKIQALMESTDHGLDTYVESYVRAKHEEFFK